jgi:predicted RNase H-like nuclease
VTRAATRWGGLDGCLSGWVLAALDDGGGLDVSVVTCFGDALARVVDGDLATLTVDMPIGLPEDGRRAADRDARARLGSRRSTLFPTPCRATLHATAYDEALALSRQTTGAGLSVQAFHLLPRMREVDHVMRPDLQDRVVECHPELAFAALSGAALVSSKHTPDGIAARIALLDGALRSLGGDARRAASAVEQPPRGARADDVADAIAIALVARRLDRGQVERLGDGAVDQRGLRMEIVV